MELGDQTGGELINQPGDHHVQICDLVVQLEIATRQRFERDPLCRGQIPLKGEIRTPGCHRPGQLHFRVMVRSDSRSPSGALTMVLCTNRSAKRRAAVTVLRKTLSTRKASVTGCWTMAG